MRKTCFFAMTALTVATLFTGCKKDDPDAIDMSILKKGVQIVYDAQGNQHEVVDLGFTNGLLWSTCNLGANSPQELGNFYAWGETEPKESYSEANYKWTKEEGTVFTKYTLKKDEKDVKMDPIDGKQILDATDDAVKVALGDHWKIPLKEDFTELTTACKRRCCKLNGVWGYLFTSKETGNSIFLPLAGFYDETDNFFIGTYGYYWTNYLSSDTREATHFYMVRPENNPARHTTERYLGLSIRPVYK
jgi:hypothetical protein